MKQGKVYISILVLLTLFLSPISSQHHEIEMIDNYYYQVEAGLFTYDQLGARYQNRAPFYTEYTHYKTHKRNGSRFAVLPLGGVVATIFFASQCEELGCLIVAPLIISILILAIPISIFLIKAKRNKNKSLKILSDLVIENDLSHSAPTLHWTASRTGIGIGLSLLF